MKKIKRIAKENIVSFILGGIFFGSIGVYAATMLSSNQINYSNANSKLQATNVQAAIDELYGKSLVAASRPVSLGQYYFRGTSAFGAQSSAGSSGSGSGEGYIIFDTSKFDKLTIGSASSGISLTLTDSKGTTKKLTINGATVVDLKNYVSAKFQCTYSHGTVYNSDSWGGGSWNDTCSLGDMVFYEATSLSINQIYIHTKSNFGALSSAGSNGSGSGETYITLNTENFSSLSIGSTSRTISVILTDEKGATSTKSVNGATTMDLTNYISAKFQCSYSHGTEYNTSSWGGGGWDDTCSIGNINFTK